MRGTLVATTRHLGGPLLATMVEGVHHSTILRRVTPELDDGATLTHATRLAKHWRTGLCVDVMEVSYAAGLATTGASRCWRTPSAPADDLAAPDEAPADIAHQ